jgi:hypothetical protein
LSQEIVAALRGKSIALTQQTLTGIETGAAVVSREDRKVANLALCGTDKQPHIESLAGRSIARSSDERRDI